MDPNVNPDPTPSKPHDIAEAGPINPATGQPDHGAEAAELKSWFRENAVSLVITAGVTTPQGDHSSDSNGFQDGRGGF